MKRPHPQGLILHNIHINWDFWNFYGLMKRIKITSIFSSGVAIIRNTLLYISAYRSTVYRQTRVKWQHISLNSLFLKQLLIFKGKYEYTSNTVYDGCMTATLFHNAQTTAESNLCLPHAPNYLSRLGVLFMILVRSVV